MRAGFSVERVRAEAVIQGQPGQFGLPTLVKLMRQRFMEMGTSTEGQLDDLVRRLEDEERASTEVYVRDMSFCVWGAKTLG